MIDLSSKESIERSVIALLPDLSSKIPVLRLEHDFNHDIEFYGTFFKTEVQNLTYLYFMHHKSVNALEVYRLTKRQLDNTEFGASPISYLDYVYIDL